MLAVQVVRDGGVFAGEWLRTIGGVVCVVDGADRAQVFDTYAEAWDFIASTVEPERLEVVDFAD